MTENLQFKVGPPAGPPAVQRWQRSFATALLVATLLPAAAKPDPAVEIGANLREATLQGLNGPERKLSGFRGKPLLINVWASWSGWPGVIRRSMSSAFRPTMIRQPPRPG